MFILQHALRLHEWIRWGCKLTAIKTDKLILKWYKIVLGIEIRQEVKEKRYGDKSHLGKNKVKNLQNKTTVLQSKNLENN